MDCFRRVSPVAPRPRRSLDCLTEPTAGAQPWPRERVLMPLKRSAVVLPAGSRFSRPLHQIVGKPAQQPRQFHQVFLAPARERLPCQPLARRVQHFGHDLALFSDDRLGHAAVLLARAPSDEAQIFELRDLPADRRVVAANPVRQFAHPERPAALDQHPYSRV